MSCCLCTHPRSTVERGNPEKIEKTTFAKERRDSNPFLLLSRVSASRQVAIYPAASYASRLGNPEDVNRRSGSSLHMSSSGAFNVHTAGRYRVIVAVSPATSPAITPVKKSAAIRSSLSRILGFGGRGSVSDRYTFLFLLSLFIVLLSGAPVENPLFF